MLTFSGEQNRQVCSGRAEEKEELYNLLSSMKLEGKIYKKNANSLLYIILMKNRKEWKAGRQEREGGVAGAHSYQWERHGEWQADVYLSLILWFEKGKIET